MNDKIMVNLQTLRSRPPTPVRGFTRTDLCGAIAAVCIIAGLVLPVLARSNNGSSRAVCFNNLKQMGMAMNMYADDYRDYLAFCNWDGGNSPGPGWLYSGTVANLNPTTPLYRNNAVGPWESGAWFNYINDPKAYLCPLDVQLSNYPQRANQLSSYVMDGAAAGFDAGNSYTTCKITQVWSPSCILMWEPDTRVAGINEYNDGANYPANGENLAPLHTPDGSEVLSVGGNVTFVTTNGFAAQSAGTGRTLLWWSPFSVSGH